MIDLQKLSGFPTRRPLPRVRSSQDTGASDDRSESKYLTFFNLPLLGLCVASWAVLSVSAVAVRHLF